MRYIPFLLLSLAFSLTSCNDDVEQLGKTQKSASVDFQLIDSFDVVVRNNGAVAGRNPNFGSNDSVYLTAEFNEEVTVEVKFIGTESGAVRTKTVDAQQIDLGDLFWVGEHEGWDFFRKDEFVCVECRVFGLEEVWRDTLQVACPNDYRGGRNNALYDWSFEDAPCDDNPGIGQFPFFGPYGIPDIPAIAENNSTPNGTSVAHFFDSKNKTGYRNGSSFLGGVGRGSALTFFNGLLDLRNFSSSVSGNTPGQWINFTTNPDSVWFNVFIYGQGDPHVRAIIVLGETDCPDGMDCSDFRTTDDLPPATSPYWDSHSALLHDRVLINQSLEHVGWKLFSYRYSSIPFASNIEFGGNGNKIYEPHRLQLIDVTLESDLPGYAEFMIDFPIITFGGPFDPTKL